MFNFFADTVLLAASTYFPLIQTCVLEGRAIFAHCAGSPALCLSKLIWSRTVTVSLFFKWATTSPLRPAWPRALTLAATSAGPGTSVTAGSLMGLAGAALCFFLTGAGLGAGSTAGAGALGAGATAGDGAGMGGSEFVLSCATALIAIITPKVNQ